ncbi:MAG: hypothetical protein HUJ98_03655 [Bacteroidaceae bacterium]|nr:hypothetical protein [Bacteroidaceae bacterium]
MKEMTCPECKGKSFRKISYDKYECNYCGATVKDEDATPEQPAAPAAPKSINVNVSSNNGTQQKPMSPAMQGCMWAFVIIFALWMIIGFMALLS